MLVCVRIFQVTQKHKDLFHYADNGEVYMCMCYTRKLFSFAKIKIRELLDTNKIQYTTTIQMLNVFLYTYLDDNV